MKETLTKLITLMKKTYKQPTSIGLPSDCFIKWSEELSVTPLTPEESQLFEGIEIYRNAEDRNMKVCVKVIF